MNQNSQGAQGHVDAPVRVSKNDNPMLKIILLVGGAIALFLAFSTFSVQKAVQSNSNLSDIRDLYFPVLERADRNIVRLDKMEEQFMQGVMMADKDTVDKAQPYYMGGDKTFAEMASLYPGRKTDILRLKAEFTGYRNLAYQTATGMINHTGSFSDVAKMNASLGTLKKNLTNFRSSSYDNFVKTLLQTQQATKLNLYLGMAIGAMNLMFMGVLVFFIRNNLHMTAIIAEQNATLELKVIERTAQLTQKTNDVNTMLDNMSLGVCTVVQGNKIHPEYSAFMHQIFGEAKLAGRDVLEALFASSNLGSDARDLVEVSLSSMIGEDMMMFEFNSHNLATEMQLKAEDGASKILQLHWSPIKNEDDAVDKVLLIVQDVTHLRALELEAAAQKAELDIISQIIKISIGKFNEFVDSAQKFIADNYAMIRGTSVIDKEVVAGLFRNMHTVKGNARTYEFKAITDVAHEAEQEYDRMRKGEVTEWNQEKLLEELAAVEKAVNRYIEINEDKLGRKGRASDMLTTRGVFVGRDEISMLQTLLLNIRHETNGQLSSTFETLEQKVLQIGLIPLQRLVSGAVDSLSSLAKELNKPTPEVHIENGDIAFNNLVAQSLKSSFMHIVRNSLDHGIEGPEQRRQAGKEEVGKISFRSERTADTVLLKISDDGRGLALHKLFEKGVAAGRFMAEEQPSPNEVAELIFESGLSTAEQVSQVSGRGVGMDAVRMFLKEQGGDIRIVLQDNVQNELGFCPFEFVISLPLSSLMAV